jgi:hypothetical protein
VHLLRKISQVVEDGLTNSDSAITVHGGAPRSSEKVRAAARETMSESGEGREPPGVVPGGTAVAQVPGLNPSQRTGPMTRKFSKELLAHAALVICSTLLLAILVAR